MDSLKNYGYNLLYQITALIVPFITTPYISRLFGADGVGSYSVSYAIAQYFCMFGLLGLNNFGTRQIAYCRDNTEECRITFWNLNYMRTITMGTAIIVYIFYTFYFVESSKVLLYFSQIPVLLASFFDISWYFAGLEEFKSTAIRSIIVKIVGVILVFLFVKQKTDIWLYALIISGTLFGGQIAMWSIALRRLKIIRPQIGKIIEFLVSTVAFWIPAIAINVYTSLDKVMLEYISNDTEAGYYENSQRMIKMVSTVTTTLAAVMSPKMSNYFINKKIDVLRETVYKTFRFVTMLAAPMTFGVIAVRNTFVPWFYGDGFSKVSFLLLVSAWLVVTLSWSNVLGNQILIACGREKYYTISVSIAAVENIVLNSILIPKYACLGAIIASIVAEYTGMILMIYFSKEIVYPRELFKGLYKYFINGMIMGIISFMPGIFLGNNIVTTMIQVLVGILIYLLLLIIEKDEFALAAIKRLTRKKWR